MSQPTPSKTDHDARHKRDVDPDGDVGQRGAPDDELRALWLDSDAAGDLISSLSSDTARSIVVELHDQPATASELADAVGTSVQNVRHHLDSLQESGIVQVDETRYSSKGREMDVYAPADEPMVVFVGNSDRSGFVDSLKRFLGAIGVLAAASLAIQLFVVSRFSSGSNGVPRVPEVVGDGGQALLGVPPGLLFFAGGALVLALVSLYHYWQSDDDAVAPA